MLKKEGRVLLVAFAMAWKIYIGTTSQVIAGRDERSVYLPV